LKPTHTAEVTVLTVDSINGMDMSQYAQEVFDKWKIGKADKGQWIIICTQKTLKKSG